MYLPRFLLLKVLYHTLRDLQEIKKARTITNSFNAKFGMRNSDFVFFLIFSANAGTFSHTAPHR